MKRRREEAVEAPVIRKVIPEDRQQWSSLWDGYNEFYGRSGETALPAEVTETTWSRFFDQNEPVEALVASRGPKLLGIAHYLFHLSTTSIKPYCYLQDIFTRADERGSGVGRLLVEHVCCEAGRAGASRVYWQTHHTNTSARSLYDKIAIDSGFIVYRIML